MGVGRGVWLGLLKKETPATRQRRRAWNHEVWVEVVAKRKTSRRSGSRKSDTGEATDERRQRLEALLGVEPGALQDPRNVDDAVVAAVLSSVAKQLGISLSIIPSAAVPADEWDSRRQLHARQRPLARMAMQIAYRGLRLAYHVVAMEDDDPRWRTLPREISDTWYRMVGGGQERATVQRQIVCDLLEEHSVVVSRYRVYRLVARRELALPVTRAERRLLAKVRRENAEEYVEAMSRLTGNARALERAAKLKPANAAAEGLLYALQCRDPELADSLRPNRQQLEHTLEAWSQRGGKWTTLHALLQQSDLEPPAPNTLQEERARWRAKRKRRSSARRGP